MEENNNQQPQYQQYQPQYQKKMPTSGASIASLILGIISILASVLMVLTLINLYMGLDVTRLVSTAFIGMVSGIIAIVLGARERKSGLGKAGLTCGIIGTAGYVGIVLFLTVFMWIF